MSLQTREIFHKDPLAWQLVNEGVSSNNSTDLTTLRYELQSFVCDGEYRTGLVRILEGYLTNFSSPEQKAVWVSGFYGSGKSHLVKVLRYLWTNFDFGDGNTARTLATLPDEVLAPLKEISTLGKKHQGLHAAGGTLKADKGSVRMRLLSIIFASIGLRREYPYAKFCLHLRRDGKLDELRSEIAAQGKDFDAEITKLYSSAAIAKAYVKLYPHIGDTTKVGPTLRAEYANVDDVGIPEMLDLIRLALGNGGKLPCTLVVLDEVQQFVDGRPDFALDIQEVTEACSKQLDSRVMFIGTGQSALSDSVQALQKLMGRYTIKVHLRDNDVERVVRTVVLQKKENTKGAVQSLVSKYEGEITRHLKSSRIGTLSEDHTAYVPDFPLLPSRRRFWERVLHSVDPTGTTAQMRTQLRVVHEACRAYGDRPLGAVVPADFIYEQLATDLVQTGEMQKRFQEIIDEQVTKPDGKLRRRICALVFLINKLPREIGTDIGVRAEAEHLSDLLVDDLPTGSTQLRQQLPDLLKKLVEDGVLMDIDGEFRLQTTEGASWEGEFRKRRAAAINDVTLIDAQRRQLLSDALTTLFSGLMVNHGAAREKRRIYAHIGSGNPPAADGITLWVRDEFTETQTTVLNDIKQRSTEDAVLHLFIPKSHAEELKQAIASAQAAEQTLHFKGNPTTTEGQEARRAIQTRFGNDTQRIDDLIGNIIRQARLFVSGGQEQTVVELRSAVEAAGEAVLARLYPKFDVADSANWPTVRNKAKEGAPNSLQYAGHTGDVQTHPVAKALIDFIGAGKKGTDIRKHYTDIPYGWPQDAIDAVLTALLVSNHLSARLQGAALTSADSDIRKLGLADYRVEQPVLGAKQKIDLRKLYAVAGINAKPGNELADAGQFLIAADALARTAGGCAPAPAIPSLATLQGLEGKLGNELLQALHDQRDSLATRIAEWKKTAEAISVRRPVFDRTERLLACAAGRMSTDAWADTLAAIRINRSLLDDPDPVAPVVKALGEALRTALANATDAYVDAHSEGHARLAADATWAKITPAKQSALVASAGVHERPTPAAGTDDELLSSLNHCPLATWAAHTDALGSQFDRALSAAVKELEPNARRVSLPGATLRSSADLDAWLAQARATLEASLKDGPVIV